MSSQQQQRQTLVTTPSIMSNNNNTSITANTVATTPSSSSSTTPQSRFSYIRPTTLATPCHACSQNVQFNSIISNDQFVFHRECFKCAKCEKYIAEQDSTYTLNETTRLLYCGFCSIRRKSMTPSSNIQSMIASINNNNSTSVQQQQQHLNHHHALVTTPSNTTTTTTPTPSLLINRTSISSTTSVTTPINDLKSRFEQPGAVVSSNNTPTTTTNTNMVVTTPSASSSSSVQLRGAVSSSSARHAVNDTTTPTLLLSASTTTLVGSTGGGSRSSHVITPRESKNYSAAIAAAAAATSSSTRQHTDHNTETPDSNVVKLRRSIAAVSNGLSANSGGGEGNRRSLISNRLSSPEATADDDGANIINTNQSAVVVVTSPGRSRRELKQQHDDCDINWVNLKTHSAKCNIMLRKKRRGNKRSKSLPPKFDIDSLLDYFNYSMILNRYELKKLHQLHNAYFNMSNHHQSQSGRSLPSSQQAKSTTTNNSLASNPNNSHLLMNNQAPLRPITSNVITSRNGCIHPHHHQFSSGYNSENHSNSSNSTGTIYYTTTTYTTQQNVSNNPNNNLLNFYRMSLNHLPLNFTNTQCTCGGGGGASIVNGDHHSQKSNSLNHHAKHGNSGSNSSNSLLSKSLSNQNISFRGRQKCVVMASSPKVDNDDDDDDDEDDVDDDDEDNYLDEDDDNIDEDLDDEEEEEDADKENNKQVETTTDAAATATMTTTAAASDIRFNFTSGGLQRAPGTSNCPHTARIDIRRVRSLHDLTHQQQLIFSEADFVFEEKLGEGFFANVKKIVSKKSKQEMVLKELKLNCVSFANNNYGEYGGTMTGETVSSSSSSLAATDNNNQSLPPLLIPPPPPRMDLISNYAELNAAHKSFLKEAQVLRNLHHPNVIKFMGIMFTKEKQFNLILEYIGGGTLKDIIHNISIALPWKLRVGYARDIAAAMQYLHSLNIIHRDLKSDNCLVRENGRTVVVADFGLSRINNSMSMSGSSGAGGGSSNINSNTGGRHLNSFLLNDLDDSTSSLLKFPPPPTTTTTTQCSSNNVKSANSSATNSFIVAAKRKLKRRYNNSHQRVRQNRYAVVGNSFSMAPEMLKHQIYDERVDIFSFGIICCEIIGRVQADPDYLPRTSDFGLNVELFRKKYCEADCPKHFIRIAIACCELDPEKRPAFGRTHLWLETILSHLEANNPIPKNLLKNILDSNNKNNK